MWVEDRGRKIATPAVTGVGVFMVLLDITIVSVALPTVQQDLHASLWGLSWVVDAYTLPFAALLLTFGSLGDRLGRKRLFVAGRIAFTAGSLMCAAAPAMGVLEVGRTIQGVGRAALSPASLALIATVFPQERERTRAVGLWSAITGLALAAGPLVGGLLIQITGSWRAVFVVNVPLGVFAVLLGVRMLPDTHQRRSDALGSGLRTLPTTASIALTAPLAGRLAGRFGYRVPVTQGTTLAAVGIALLTRLDADTAYRDIWWTLALSASDSD